MRIKTSDFPKFERRTRPYAAIRRYFDNVKPWCSKYNPDNERPIGSRACKLTSDGDGFLRNYSGLTAEDRARDREGARFNKAMRMLSDGSIAFRLYDHDCVVYHPDNTLTIHGYPTVSTNDFISGLTPMGISHTCRGRGRDNAHEPVLRLMPVVKHVWPADRYLGAKEYCWTGPDWSAGMVINCEQPVTLHYNVARRHYVPSNPSVLEPFRTFSLDHAASREVSQTFQLRKFEEMASLGLPLALMKERDGDASFAKRVSRIEDALHDGNLAEALRWVRRGESDSFGRVHGTLDGVKPGFLKRLRWHLYDVHGAVIRKDESILTPAQYKRYKADGKRFD